MTSTVPDQRGTTPPDTSADSHAAADQDLANARGPWAIAAINGTRYWAVAMGAYLVITLCAWQIGDKPHTFGQLFGSWRQWDTGWYLGLATQGYPHAGASGPPPPVAWFGFYPLYPLLIRAVHVVVPGDVAISAFVVSVAAFLGLLIVLFRFLDSELRDRAAVHRAMWYLLAFPTAFFLAAPFPMALFLMLAVASIYYMRQGRWWAAAAIGAVATSARASAPLLVAVFLLEYLRQRNWDLRKIRADLGWVALIPTGLLAYLAYAKAMLGDFLAPFHAQQNYWLHALDWPWVGPMEAARHVVGGAGPDFVLYPVIDVLLLGTVVALLVAGIVGRYQLDRDQWTLVAFGAGAVLFAISFPMPDYDDRVHRSVHARLPRVHGAGPDWGVPLVRPRLRRRRPAAEAFAHDPPAGAGSDS
jgi:hypothetical protein